VVIDMATYVQAAVRLGTTTPLSSSPSTVDGADHTISEENTL
jgi:hypothetical protein